MKSPQKFAGEDWTEFDCDEFRSGRARLYRRAARSLKKQIKVRRARIHNICT